MAWAIEFNKRFPSVPVDEALTWFCNAIMRGYDSYAAKHSSRADATLAPTLEWVILSTWSAFRQIVTREEAAKCFADAIRGTFPQIYAPRDDGYAITLQRMIEAHCRGERVEESGSPHLGAMLNAALPRPLTAAEHVEELVAKGARVATNVNLRPEGDGSIITKNVTAVIIPTQEVER